MPKVISGVSRCRRRLAADAVRKRRAHILAEERGSDLVFTHKEDMRQSVRVWNDTGVVAALLYMKRTEAGKPLEYRLWFSDGYLRTGSGWRYTFGQASIGLPSETC